MKTLIAVVALVLLHQPGESPRVAGQGRTTDSFYVVAGYDEARNPFADLELARDRARREGKRILLQVGGDWCGWCHILDRFIQEHGAVNDRIRAGFLIMKVTFTLKNENRPFLSRYPPIPGYPHLFVLEGDGTFLHSQPTAELEEGKSYNEQAILRFLDAWRPGATRLDTAQRRDGMDEYLE